MQILFNRKTRSIQKNKAILKFRDKYYSILVQLPNTGTTRGLTKRTARGILYLLQKSNAPSSPASRDQGVHKRTIDDVGECRDLRSTDR
jgi:hypothetical protein